MRTILRTLVVNALLTAPVGLLTADDIAAADAPRISSPKAHPSLVAAIAQVECDYVSVRCVVRVNNYLLAHANPVPRSFRLREVWRYAPDTKQWTDVTPKNILPVAILAPKSRALNSSKHGQVLFELPHLISLYHLRWMEGTQRHEGSAVVGPTLCNDISLKEPAPPGTYAGCWPSARGASAGYVPNPPPPRD
jgi:hypothetical protein